MPWSHLHVKPSRIWDNFRKIAWDVTTSWHYVRGSTYVALTEMLPRRSRNSYTDPVSATYTLKHPGQTWSGKGSIGAKLHSGSTMTRKSVSLTRNMTQSWVNLTPLFVKSAESWPHSGSLLTRNGVWPQWTLFRVTLTRVFLECIDSVTATR